MTEGIVRVTSVDEVAGINESKDLSEGDVFGLLGLVPNMPSADTASAVTDVRAAMLTRHPYEQLFTAAPALARQLQYMIAIRLARALQDRNRTLRAMLRRDQGATAPAAAR